MPDIKVSALAESQTVADTDVVLVITGAGPRKATIARINRKVMNNSTASQALTASTLTLVNGSLLTLPTGVAVGTSSQFQWKVIATKTAAGTAASVFHVRCGTLGTSADPIVFTFTTNAGTAVIDTARIDILVTVRTAGTSGVLQGTFSLEHNLAATGWITIAKNVITSTSAAIDLARTGLKFSVTATTGAALVATVQQVSAEVTGV